MLNNVLPFKYKISLPIRQQISDSVDKYGFLAAFLIGFIGIAILKKYDFSQLWITAYPVTIILSYAFILYVFNRMRLHEDQAGDNLYYLGFLFTLISLAYALYQFDPNGGTAKVIENFGIALSTSIVGLFLRITFNKMRTDPVEIEKHTRIELTTAASRLRSEIIDATETIKNTLMAVQQQTQETIQNNLKQSDDIRAVILDKTRCHHEQFIENISEVNKKSEEFVKAVMEMSNKINNISFPDQLLDKQLSPVINRLEEAFNKISRAAETDQKNAESIGHFIDHMKHSNELINEKIIQTLKSVELSKTTRKSAFRSFLSFINKRYKK